MAALNLVQKAKQTLGDSGGDAEARNTALIDGVRKYALLVTELDIDLIDKINRLRGSLRHLGQVDVLQPSTTDLSITQSKYGRRFAEEFKREVAALACRPGAKQEQVARDLGVSPYSVSRWKKLYGSATCTSLHPLASTWPNSNGASKHSGARTQTCASRGRT